MSLPEKDLGRQGQILANQQVISIPTEGVPIAIAGTGLREVARDGTNASLATLADPTGIAVTPGGAVIMMPALLALRRQLTARRTLATSMGCRAKSR